MSNEPRATLKGAPARFGASNVLRGLQAAGSGQVISLNRELDEPAPFGRRQFKRTMRLHNNVRPLGDGRYIVINDDEVEFALQGSSQWDAFSHVGLIDRLNESVYHGGFGFDETYPVGASENLGIQALGPGIVARGVLLDVVHAVDPSVDYLDGDLDIDRALLEKCVERQRVMIEPGDALFIYTGFELRLQALSGSWPSDAAGLVADTVPYLTDLDLLALVSDNLGVEATPPDFAVHIGILRDAGVPLGELWALEALAQACRADGRYEFLLVSVPLNINGAFGSTANAVAVR